MQPAGLGLLSCHGATPAAPSSGTLCPKSATSVRSSLTIAPSSQFETSAASVQDRSVQISTRDRLFTAHAILTTAPRAQAETRKPSLSMLLTSSSASCMNCASCRVAPSTTAMSANLTRNVKGPQTPANLILLRNGAHRQRTSYG